MARPIKQGLDYFPFDVDFFSDEKLNAISWEFGIKGEITTIKLLCAIYRNGYFIEWTEMLMYKLLKQLPGVSPELLENIVNRLVKWDFFDKSLFDSAKILTSRGIQRRYVSISSKTHRKKIIPVYNLLDEADENEVCPESESKSDESRQPAPKKNRQNQSAPQPAPSVGQYGASFADEIKRMKKDTAWIEQGICMKLKIKKSEVPALLKEFLAHCISYCSEKPHKSYGDAQRHFIRWFNSHSQASSAKSSQSKEVPSESDYSFSGGFGGEDV